MLFLVEASSFWLESDRGVRYLMLSASVLPSGLLLPLAFFPNWAQTLFLATPFPHTLNVPTQVWLGKLVGPELAWALALQLAWALALTAFGHLVVRWGARRLQVHGG